MKWIFVLISFWLTFVLSLAGWWLYFGISVLSRSPQLLAQNDLVRHQKMLFQEGCVLMLFLLGGGLGLFYFSFRMYKEKSVKENFFASFTHDLKTALFRLQLQIEKLGQSVGEEKVDPVLIQTRNIHIDLENGLDLSIGHQKKLFIEKINLKNFLSELHTQWPEFHIKLLGEDAIVMADRKGIQSIFKNLLHNSSFHGSAEHIQIEIRINGDYITMDYSDNGKSFVGSTDQLGRSPSPSAKGSGYGLYIVRYWVERMKGRLAFSKSKNGSLSVEIHLLRGLA